MQPSLYEIHNHIKRMSGIENLDEVIGFYNFNNGTIVQILEGRVKGETQTRYYARIGDETEFRECKPRAIITSSLGYFKNSLGNKEMIAEVLGLYKNA